MANVAAIAGIGNDDLPGQSIGRVPLGRDRFPGPGNDEGVAAYATRHQHATAQANFPVVQVSPLGRREVVIEQDRQPNRFGDVLSIIWERRRGDDNADSKSRFRLEPSSVALEHQTEQIGPRSSLQGIEDSVARIAEPAGEFEWPNAAFIDHGVEVDIAAIAVVLEERTHLAQSSIEKPLAAGIGDNSPHLAGKFTEVAREKPLVFPVKARRLQEILAIEIGADAHLNPLDELH